MRPSVDSPLPPPLPPADDTGTALPPPEPPRRQRITTLGDYRLGEKIGGGATGSVYRAQRISSDRPAAIKILRPHLARNRVFLERFLREARVMARLSHPNVVRCYGMGKRLGRYYIAMELVEGASLGDWLYRRGKLSIGDAVHVALAIARALQHAHQNGLVHSDIKPDNILITLDGEVKVTDLGLARPVLGEAPAGTGRGAGTPVYMAPEQARGDSDPDPRSDLYALGCVLYQMLTGRFPFRGPSSLEVILAKVEGNLTPARDLNPAVPPALDAVLALLLLPHPDERYQCATDLVNDLEELDLAHPALRFPHESGDFEVSSGTSPSIPTDVVTVPEEKSWYVLFPTPEGQWGTRQFTTTEVLRALQDQRFAHSAQISPHRGDYRHLADFPEFRTALDLLQVEAPADDEAAESADGDLPGPPPRRRWLRLLVASVAVLAIGALGFRLGQLLAR